MTYGFIIQQPSLRKRRLLLRFLLFLNREALNVLVGFCQLIKFRFKVVVGLGHIEFANATRYICFDVGKYAGFCQSASDRGGTSTSLHVRDVECHRSCFGGIGREYSLSYHRGAERTSYQRRGQ